MLGCAMKFAVPFFALSLGVANFVVFLVTGQFMVGYGDNKPSGAEMLESSSNGILQFQAYGQKVLPDPMPNSSMPSTKSSYIPCLIHQTWKARDSMDDEMKNSVESFKSKNPQCIHRLWFDDEIEALVAEHFADFLPINLWQGLKPVQRADLFRYMVIYLYGGFYADLDVTCKKPIEEWDIENNTQVVVGYETGWHLDEKTRRHVGFSRNEQFEQWLFGGIAGHPIFQRCLELFRLRFEWGIENTVELTGPGLFTDSVREFLLAKTRGGLFMSRHTNESTTSAPPDGKLPLHFPPPGIPSAGVLVLAADQVAVPGFSSGSENAKTVIRHGFKGTWKNDAAELYSTGKGSGGDTKYSPVVPLIPPPTWPTGEFPACKLADINLQGEPGGNAVFADLGKFLTPLVGPVDGCSNPACDHSDKFRLDTLANVTNSDSLCASVCKAFVSNGCQFWVTGPEDGGTKCWLRSRDSASAKAPGFEAGKGDCVLNGTFAELHRKVVLEATPQPTEASPMLV